ncbi:MAG: bifunctional phosphopantothenoylcysteine decarboxylase/phosphopantothenate--cysteine ligase CoaBC [Proteobacteria bacterium]|jgi:phosphopantothenoylcysteine decarboxylase/phosphopantothenate--cysteine ligase|nr:bifunctional phosphopantothenoylcysteine decarboxylase/phosphopantothenate--cysteine ligase CoaBC [Alphaproteobacteria bacterium]NCC02993.1 bifunctional phosphopantothenoylcysteine decarboxylase/phosphopantothenate--cysteine ligase CoaBC [Pseudomonadota bacterium]
MSHILRNRKILLIISGGIAAYKSLELIRKLKDHGAQVRCILTAGGAQFITPLSVTALSQEPCLTNLFSPEDEKQFGHIRLSRESDLIVVAPASANLLAKMAHGLADTLASAVLLAATRPIMVAPAMNCAMWAHPATQANIKTLRTRGILQVGPESGHLACGDTGEGRMSQPDEIMQNIIQFFQSHSPLTGRHFIVTSGPTFEPIDPVRFIGNRSSGKQGHAIAQALALQGARVTLVTGPTALPAPVGIHTIAVQTAREMLQACLNALPADGAICAAAVADWRPETEATQKIKKGSEATPLLHLVENPDILATLSEKGEKRPPLVVGFAAETDHLEANATAKLARKGCDWLLANNVTGGQIFGEDENEVTLYRQSPTGTSTTTAWPRCRKEDIAQKLVEEIETFFAIPA